MVRLLTALVGLAGLVGATPPLTQQEMADAVAMGRRCQAPIVRESSPRGDYEIYVESPFARVALVAATALVMHQPIDAPGAQRAMQGGYRIWFVRSAEAPLPGTVTRVSIRSGAQDILPVAERNERLFLGTVPSHGIIEPLRARFPEYVFDRLPSGSFVVAVETSRGTDQFRITARNRTELIRVCN